MKKNSNLYLQCCQNERGIVLVTVVLLVALLLIMVVAFLGLTSSERKASVALAQDSEAFTLGNSALNLVISQLRTATSNLGTTETWASQPGMIRRYDNTGALTEVFRLYSAPDLATEVSGNFSPDGELPPADWKSQTATWTDLNAPERQSFGGGSAAGGELRYPILDPSALENVEGLSVESAPGAGVDLLAPMPVQWLYVLEDGSIVPVVGGGGDVAQVGGAPSGNNPIVGRVAFWADDETCKVNVNTASEGVFWDTPRTNSAADELLADRQPVKNEFQRYPGHPATTSLSPILGKWLGDDPLDYYALTPRVAEGGSNGGTRSVDEDTPVITLDRDRLYPTVDEYVFKSSSAGGAREKNHPGLTEDVVAENRFLLTTTSSAPEVNLFNQPRISLWPIQTEGARRSPVDELIAFCASIGSRTAPMPFYFQRETIFRGLADSSSQSPSRDFDDVPRNQELYEYLQKATDKAVPGFGGKFSTKFGSDRDQVLTEMLDFVRSGVSSLSKGNVSGNYDYAPARGIEGEGQIIPLRIGSTMGFGRNVTITEAAIVIYPTAVALPSDLPPGASPIVEVPVPPGTPGGDTRKVLRAKSVKAYLMVEYFCATPGFPAWSPALNIDLAVSGFALAGRPLYLQSGRVTPNALIGGPGAPGDGGGRWQAGYGHTTSMFGMFQPFMQPGGKRRDFNSRDARTGYAWHSIAPVPLPLTGPEGNPGNPGSGLDFSGGTLTFTLRNARDEEIQTVAMTFEQTTVPVPYIWPKNQQVMTDAESKIAAGQSPDWASLYYPIETDLNARMRILDANERAALASEFADKPEMATAIDDVTIDLASIFLIRPGDVVRGMEASATATPRGDLRFYAATPAVPSDWFTKGGFPGQYDSADRVSGRFAHGLRQNNNWQFLGQFASYPMPNSESVGQMSGDRLVPAEVAYSSDVHPFARMPTILTSGSLVEGFHPFQSYPEVNWFQGTTSIGNEQKVLSDGAFTTARGVSAALRSDGRPGDFDTGFGMTEDGPFINKPDESNSYREDLIDNFANEKHLGSYYSRGLFKPDPKALNNVPNRQIASAVAFGSLPSGIKRGLPWQTLLFSPNPAGRTTPATEAPSASDHPGFDGPPDHLLLDLFWMPVVQPYAISQPLATSGKININYQIMPFTYIKRRTPMHALFKGVQMAALSPLVAAPVAGGGSYHQSPDDSMIWESRYNINLDPEVGTLRGFERRFDDGEIFRSASEVAEVFLVPERREAGPENPVGRAYPARGEASYDAMVDWWSHYELTGDNLRESPYGQIYPRITTKSNTYQVHLRVQTIQKNRDTPANEFRDGKDVVTAEYRGSAVIERFVDPNDPRLPDFAEETDEALDDYYRFRISQRQEFLP